MLFSAGAFFTFLLGIPAALFLNGGSISLGDFISFFPSIPLRGDLFSVLQSVGMTREGIKRMLRLEATLCSIKALLIGLPVGILASYGLHQAVGLSASFSYELPWFPIGASIAGVFIITWITMHTAANRLKDRNIIETIRSGSGM
jgi:putative ABC transport system permease protein